MKEIDLNGITVYEYENNTIYQNRKNIRYCYLVSLVIAILSAIAYVIVNTVFNTWTKTLFEFYSYFFAGLLFFPICLYFSLRKEYEKKPSKLTNSEINTIRKRLKSNKNIMNSAPSTSSIIAAFAPEFYEILVCVMFGLQSRNIHIAFVMFGYMLPTYLGIYIASAYFIKNYLLMKKEWETAPPPSAQLQPLQDKKAEIEEKKRQRKYEKLIKQCGVRFFIKYYKEIVSLPLRDVNITENFTPFEKQERLLSAKKIIDLNLTEYTLNAIINTYSNILNEDEIEQAKLLLTEVRANKI